MKKPTILIVDDELEILQLLKKFLENEDFEVFCAQDGQSALDLFQQKCIDVVVTDIRMPGMDGLELLRRVKRLDDLIEVIVLTGYASIEAAVNSMKNDGAFDFLTKPIDNFEDFLISVEKALAHRHLRMENVKLLEALKESELRYRSFVENFNGIAFRLHPEGRPIFYHGAVKELTGYEETELIDLSKGWESLIHPEDAPWVVSQRNSLAVCADQSLTQEYRIRHADGQWRWVREHVQNICDNSDRPVVLQGILFDITEHKALQARSFQSRKLEAIATLAGGVAHQFNNALTGLVGNIELLEMELVPDEKIENYFSSMIKLSKRMSTLTQQLLAYARGGKYNPCDVKLGHLIKSSLELIRHRLPPKIELEVDLAARQDLVSVDTAQLQMVLLALYNNAVEALEKGGRICISTKEACFGADDLADHPNRRPGPYVCLTVQDNGCGMSKEIQSKIFDPFFTTKFIGRGLGLSAAYGIIANHNGWIAASTVRGEGTEIRVYLPLLAVKETAPSENALPQSAVIGDATLLVVEDEPLVLDAVCAMLEKMDFRVLRAETGRDALEALRACDASVDLVLLDVRLPDLDADVVYQEMHKIQPGIRVVVWSGYDNSGPVEDLLNAGADGFLQKPFSNARLIKKVLSVLGRRREAISGSDILRRGGDMSGSKHLRVVQ
jgi:PAS domain S-box-containing protein